MVVIIIILGAVKNVSVKNYLDKAKILEIKKYDHLTVTAHLLVNYAF